MHNVNVGGSPRSAHRHLALDIGLRDRRRDTGMLVLNLAKEVGFTSIGLYAKYNKPSFIHADLRGSPHVPGRRRFWWGSKSAKEVWKL